MARTKFWAGKYPWQMSSCHFMSLHAPLTLWTSLQLNITWCVHFDYSFFSLPHRSAYGKTHAVLGLHGRLFLSMRLSSRGFYIGFFAQTLLISTIFCLSVCRWAISVCFSRCFLACFLIYDVDSGISSVVLTFNDSTRDYNPCDARIRTLRRTKKDMTTIYCNGCLLILHQPALSFSSWIWTFRAERTDCTCLRVAHRSARVYIEGSDVISQPTPILFWTQFDEPFRTCHFRVRFAAIW